MSERDDICIWVDADACPVRVKELLIKAALRLDLELVFVANQSISVSRTKRIRTIVVADGSGVADDWIADSVSEFDVVITQDIPLAARVLAKNAFAIGPRGEIHDDSNIHSRVATRDLMEQFRSSGQTTPGPKPMNAKHFQQFSNALDKTITRARRQYRKKQSN